ncbi:hypothetical protein RFI_19235, partial [Reticulomyxa filosa]
MWDEYGLLLSSLEAEGHYWPEKKGTDIRVVSDIYHEPSRGGTWLVLGRDDAPFFNYYAITVKRANIGEYQSPFDGIYNRSVLYGKITLSKTVSIPPICTQQEIDPTGKEIKHIIEFQPQKISLYIYTYINSDVEKAHSSHYVSSIHFYRDHKQKYVIVGTNKGRMYDYRVSGSGDVLQEDYSYSYTNSSTASDTPILHVYPAFRKLEVAFVTKFGWQLMRIPRFRESSTFCEFDEITDVSSVAADQTLTNYLYIGTSQGELLVYDMKQRLGNEARCWCVDRFFVGTERVPLALQTISGYVFVATNSSFYVYN